MELHATLSLFRDQPLRVSIAPDKQGERDFLPKPDELKGKLFLGDRGYEDIDYCSQVKAAEGDYLIRFTKKINPTVVECWISGQRCERLEGRKLSEIRAALPKRKAVDLDVEWIRGGEAVRSRLVILEKPKAARPKKVKSKRARKKQTAKKTKPPRQDRMQLATSLDRESFSTEVIAILYRLRWQVELLFKEWKSYANLHSFDTGKVQIAKGLMWASLAAALLKRFLAHATQLVFGVETSTRSAAMALFHHLPLLLQSFVRGEQGRLRRFEELLRFLRDNARRAHPKRDRRTGRLQNAFLRPAWVDANP